MKYTQAYKDDCYCEFLEATIIALDVLLKFKKLTNERIISTREDLIQC